MPLRIHLHDLYGGGGGGSGGTGAPPSAINLLSHCRACLGKDHVCDNTATKPRNTTPKLISFREFIVPPKARIWAEEAQLAVWKHKNLPSGGRPQRSLNMLAIGSEVAV